MTLGLTRLLSGGKDCYTWFIDSKNMIKLSKFNLKWNATENPNFNKIQIRLSINSNR